MVYALDTGLGIRHPEAGCMSMRGTGLSCEGQHERAGIRAEGLAEHLLGLLKGVLGRAHALRERGTNTRGLLAIERGDSVRVVAEICHRRGTRFRGGGPHRDIGSEVIDVDGPCIEPVIENGRIGDMRFNTGYGGVRISKLSFVRGLSFGTFGRKAELPRYLGVRQGLFNIRTGGTKKSTDCTNDTGERCYGSEKVRASFIGHNHPSLRGGRGSVVHGRLTEVETAEVRNSFKARGRRCNLGHVGTEAGLARVLCVFFNVRATGMMRLIQQRMGRVTRTT